MNNDELLQQIKEYADVKESQHPHYIAIPLPVIKSVIAALEAKQSAPEELFAVSDMIRTIIREYEVAHDKAKAVADKAITFYNTHHENSNP